MHVFAGRVKLAVQKDTGECVAVKIVTVDDKGQGGLTHECLRKEVIGSSITMT